MSKIKAEKYIGQTKTMNCGMKATIISYRNSKDIDIKFDNGAIRKHKLLDSFKKGEIGITKRKGKNDRIGQVKMMNCGMKATIIVYRGCHDIDVQFEDDTIRKHKSMNDFKTGQIAHTPFRIKTHYIGETNIMHCGIKATVIAYRGCNDIDVQFEDGTIRKHMGIANFNRCTIAHPTNILFDIYKLDKVAFVFHNKTYFYVTYTENDSEISEVMCIDDMKQKLPELTQ